MRSRSHSRQTTLGRHKALPLTMIESQRNWKFLLGVVVAFALALRLIGIHFGLPLQLHPDEWSQVETARAMLGALIRNRTRGLVAALLFSVSAAAVQQAHYATVDTAWVFWMMLALGFGLWAFKQPTRPW